MSLVQVQDVDRQAMPDVTANLPSNNPFRKFNTSPAPPYNSLTSPGSAEIRPSAAPERPQSRNPFLDQADFGTLPRSGSPGNEMSRSNGNPSAKSGGLTVDLFKNLGMNSQPHINGSHHGQASSASFRQLGSENVPPPTRDRTIPPRHRPSRSQEQEQQRMRNGGRSRALPPGLDVFADPPETGRHRRLRRNSESSIADKSGIISDLDDERRKREQRHRDREARYRGEARGRPQTAKPKKPNQRLDLIDQLDVTSIYGTGLFHHDGPFDACNPHRNRKDARRAPMEAFPKDSANNALGGSGPVHKNIDFAQFHGRGAEGFTDYSNSRANNIIGDPEPYAGAGLPTRTGPGVRPGIDRTSSFNPRTKVEQVHGDESMGLGTSTFLEGAPASRTAIQRRESESDQQGGVFGSGSGLGRKKSLVQKFRGISNANRGAGATGRVTSPLPIHERTASPTSPTEGQALSAGGTRGFYERKDPNPFFTDYDEAYERKGARIQLGDEENVDQTGGRSRALSSPKRPGTSGILERRVTNDGTGMNDGESKSGGFLSRVKSLKGGRKARPERRE